MLDTYFDPFFRIFRKLSTVESSIIINSLYLLNLNKQDDLLFAKPLNFKQINGFIDMNQMIMIGINPVLRTYKELMYSLICFPFWYSLPINLEKI